MNDDHLRSIANAVLALQGRLIEAGLEPAISIGVDFYTADAFRAHRRSIPWLDHDLAERHFDGYAGTLCGVEIRGTLPSRRMCDERTVARRTANQP
jgi:hypothetical protein